MADAAWAAEISAAEQAADAAGDDVARRAALLQVLRLKGIALASLRAPRGLLGWAHNAQIHCGGGSLRQLRLSLFIASHRRGVAFAPYGGDDQTHACQLLFDLHLYERGLRAVFFNRHLSPDAGKHYTTTAPSRAKIISAFLAEVTEQELTAAQAKQSYTLPDATLLKFAKLLCKDAVGKNTGGIPPWVPANLRE